MDYRKILDEILLENRYMCLATSDKEGRPWASPLICVTDEKYCFYFISHIHSRHCKNIEENPQVALSIYHTDQPIGNAF
jgi:nitroimidazol reductase NimA-like FMN-containing flavoprotein (pyridoxamine 5'-phosphate oxidase superfamily)